MRLVMSRLALKESRNYRSWRRSRHCDPASQPYKRSFFPDNKGPHARADEEQHSLPEMFHGNAGYPPNILPDDQCVERGSTSPTWLRRSHTFYIYKRSCLPTSSGYPRPFNTMNSNSIVHLFHDTIDIKDLGSGRRME